MKSKVLAAVREGNKTLFSMVVAQAQKVEHAGDSLVFTFAPAHRALKARLEEKRAWIEQLAQTAAGKKIAVITKEGDSGPASAAAPGDPAAAAKAAGLKARAKAEPTVQAVLDVFGGEIDDVQELD